VVVVKQMSHMHCVFSVPFHASMSSLVPAYQCVSTLVPVYQCASTLVPAYQCASTRRSSWCVQSVVVSLC
jgi:hypothetical protein